MLVARTLQRRPHGYPRGRTTGAGSTSSSRRSRSCQATETAIDDLHFLVGQTGPRVVLMPAARHVLNATHDILGRFWLDAASVNVCTWASSCRSAPA